MKGTTPISLWAVLVFHHALARVWAQSARPTDVWSTEEWGGLPALDDEVVDFGSPVATQLFAASDDVAPQSKTNPPNPCTDTNFRTPSYEFLDWNVTKTYHNSSGEFPHRFDLAATLRDTANDYSMRCFGQHILELGVLQDRFTYCIAGADDRLQSLASFQLYQRVFERDWTVSTGLYLQQFWYCAQRDDTAYSRAYKAAASGAAFNLSCPSRGEITLGSQQCNVTLPNTLKTDYTPNWFPNQTQPLLPRPLGPPAPEERPGTAPSRDCTDMSFTHPDWTVDGLTYIPNPPGTPVNVTIANLTLTSRATGSKQVCRWGGDVLASQNGELRMACNQVDLGADNSNTLYVVRFRPSYRDLSIQQDWVCGDTQGTYLRRFQATQTYVPPLICAEDGGRICRANRHTVKGILQKPVRYQPATIPPPPGATRQGCTSGSVIPSWTVRNFRFEETRSTRTIRTQALPPLSRWSVKRNLTLDIWHSAIDYATSCSITLPSDWPTNGTGPWLRCFPDTGMAQRYIQTYIKFNSSSAELKVNQTWYCSDTDPSQPLMYEGTATSRVAYCGETNTTVYDGCSWPQCNLHTSQRWCASGTFRNGQVTSSSTTVKGTILRTEKLPANALVDPDPDPNAWSCTADSLGRPVEWQFSANRAEGFFSTSWMYFSTVATPWTVLSFDLLNSALVRRPGGGAAPVAARADELTPYIPAWEPARVYDLWEQGSWRVPQGGRRPFANMLGWSLRFDAQAKYLELNQSWYCNDKNPTQPILFNGTWAGYISMDCKFSDNQENRDRLVIGCHLPGGVVTVKPTVQSQVLGSMSGLPV